MIGSLHEMRALRLWEAKDKRAAVEELKKAIENAEAVRWFSAGAERERAATAERSLEMYENMVEWRAEMGELDAVFQAIESMSARTFLDELEMNRVDFSTGFPPPTASRTTGKPVLELFG
jgi:hypothetical protein